MLLGKVPLFVSELYKTLILQKGIILLAAAVYLLISCRMYRGVDYSNTDFSMNNFYSMFSGNTGDKECEAYIEECRNAVEELGKKQRQMLIININSVKQVRLLKICRIV